MFKKIIQTNYNIIIPYYIRTPKDKQLKDAYKIFYNDIMKGIKILYRDLYNVEYYYTPYSDGRDTETLVCACITYCSKGMKKRFKAWCKNKQLSNLGAVWYPNELEWEPDEIIEYGIKEGA